MKVSQWGRQVRSIARKEALASLVVLLSAACADLEEGALQSAADEGAVQDEPTLQKVVEDAAASFTQCAVEGQRCLFTGTRQVRYGTRYGYATKTFTNGVDCTADAFGAASSRYFKKRCWYGDLIAPPAAPDAATAPADASTPPAPADASTPPAPADASTPPAPADASTPPAPADASTPPAPADASVPPPPVSDASVPAPTLPPQLCTSPLGLADTSRPATVVGTGSAASCTESTLRAAVAKGGVVTFNCGSAVTTIGITQTLVAPADRDTTIDGHDRIVLDGRGATQILKAQSNDFRVNDRVLTVQRIAMINGRDVGTGFVPRDGTKDCAWGYRWGGGGAISVRDVNVRVWGVTFEGNRGPEIGPDVAGGAIYVMGAKNLTIANSTFRNNSASNGGAVGALHVATQMYNVVMEDNRASGMLANFANASGCPTFNHELQGGAGGLGGAFYSDGFDEGDMLCGVRMADNVAGDLGGALFRSAYWGLRPDTARQHITWEKSTFERNRTTAGGGGAAYVNNSLFTVKSCKFIGNDAGNKDGGGLKITGTTVRFDDVEFTGNKSSWGGGVAHWGAGLEGKGSASNVRFSANTPNDWVGDFPL